MAVKDLVQSYTDIPKAGMLTSRHQPVTVVVLHEDGYMVSIANASTPYLGMTGSMGGSTPRPGRLRVPDVRDLTFGTDYVCIGGIGDDASVDQWTGWLDGPEHFSLGGYADPVRLPAVAKPRALTSPRNPAPETTAAHIAPEVEAATSAPLDPGASVARIASRISELSELSDEQLAAVFKVERETYCRWRTGHLANPRLGSRRRLGLVLHVLDELAAREVPVKDWLLNQPVTDELTPYQLLEEGRIEDVAYAASALLGGRAGAQPQTIGAPGDALTFGTDAEWEPLELDEVDAGG